MVTTDYSNMLERIKEETENTKEFAELYKNMLQQIDDDYKKYGEYLDINYKQQLKKSDTRSRLWEMRLIDYFTKNLEIKLQKYDEKVDKNSLKVPDFYFKHKDQVFYVEAIAVSPGENCPSLTEEISPDMKIRVLDFSKKTSETIERIQKAINDKMKNYHSYNGYKNIVNNQGFIIAVSLAKIDFPNISPSHLDLAIKELSKFLHKYPDLSAIIISYTWEGLFPELTAKFGFANWKEHSDEYPESPHPGDMRIVYNALAKYSLLRDILPAAHHVL